MSATAAVEQASALSIEQVERRKRVIERSEMALHPVRPQMLIDRGGVVLERIGEKEASLRREIVEPPRSWLQ